MKVDGVSFTGTGVRVGEGVGVHVGIGVLVAVGIGVAVGVGVLVGAKVAVGAGVGELVGAKVAIGVTVGTQVMVGNGSSVGRGVTVGTRVMVGVNGSSVGVTVGALVAVGAMVGVAVIVGVGLGLSGVADGDAQADKARKKMNNSIKMGDFLGFINVFPFYKTRATSLATSLYSLIFIFFVFTEFHYLSIVLFITILTNLQQMHLFVEKQRILQYNYTRTCQRTPPIDNIRRLQCQIY